MNSGMFFARKDSLVKNFKKYQKNIFYNCFKSIEKSRLRKNVYHLNKPAFKKIKEISFDYAILEKSKNINCIKLDMLLTDLGNWKKSGNTLRTQVQVILLRKIHIIDLGENL